MQHKNNLVVSANVSELITKLKNNLANHKEAVNKARLGFEKEAVEILNDHLNRLRAGRETGVYIHLAGVEDHSKDYERALGMLEMHNDDHIYIGAEDFARYVQDDWDWKDAWLTSNAKYLST